jgi:hypothetical protein
LLLLSGRQDLEALPAKQAETRPGSDRLGRLYEGALGCLLDQVGGRARLRDVDRMAAGLPDDGRGSDIARCAAGGSSGRLWRPGTSSA